MFEGGTSHTKMNILGILLTDRQQKCYSGRQLADLCDLEPINRERGSSGDKFMYVAVWAWCVSGHTTLTFWCSSDHLWLQKQLIGPLKGPQRVKTASWAVKCCSSSYLVLRKSSGAVKHVGEAICSSYSLFTKHDVNEYEYNFTTDCLIPLTSIFVVVSVIKTIY